MMTTTYKRIHTYLHAFALGIEYMHMNKRNVDGNIASKEEIKMAKKETERERRRIFVLVQIFTTYLDLVLSIKHVSTQN